MEEKPKTGWNLDLVGFGKIAEAIPKEVYERTADVSLRTFESLTAPLTESTAGFGRYLRQKFDNLVEAEKAIASFTVEKAVYRARKRCEKAGIPIHPPAHPKTFVRAIEEAAKETDPELHEMWTNLLASQLSDDNSHPHFVELLTHFGPAEAKLLSSLLPQSETGKKDSYVSFQPDSFTHWTYRTGDQEEHVWTISCELLLDFRFAYVAPSTPSKQGLALLYRTALGSAFLAAVTEVGEDKGQNAGAPSTEPGAALSSAGMREIVRETMHSVSGEVISIDTTPIEGPTGQTLLVPFDPHQTVFAFLSQIHWSIRDRVQQYTYGSRWVLKDTSNSAVYDAASDTERQRLFNVPIGRLGFQAGMKLRAVWVTPDVRRRARMPTPQP